MAWRLLVKTGDLAVPAIIATHLPMKMYVDYKSSQSQGKSRRQRLEEALKKAVPYLPLYLTVAMANSIYFIPFTEQEFIDQTAEFDSPPDDELLVVVNLHNQADPHHQTNKTLYDARYGDRKNARYITAESLGDMISQLEKIKRDTNKQIGSLQMNSHGFPGHLAFPLTFTKQVSDESLANLGGKIPVIKAGNTGEQEVISPSKDLLGKNAKIRLVACSVGQGEKGDRLAQQLGKLLLPEGGTIYMATPIIKNLEVSKQLGLGPDTLPQILGAVSPIESFVMRQFHYTLMMGNMEPSAVPDLIKGPIKTIKVEAQLPR